MSKTSQIKCKQGKNRKSFIGIRTYFLNFFKSSLIVFRLWTFFYCLSNMVLFYLNRNSKIRLLSEQKSAEFLKLELLYYHYPGVKFYYLSWRYILLPIVTLQFTTTKSKFDRFLLPCNHHKKLLHVQDCCYRYKLTCTNLTSSTLYQYKWAVAPEPVWQAW